MDAWGVAVVGDHEQVAREQRDADGAIEAARPAVSGDDGAEREVCLEAGAAEVASGVAFGLWVSASDGPHASARQAIPIREWYRFGRI
jgi:hypothetical protein